MKRLFASAAASLLLAATIALGAAGAAQASIYPPSDSIVASSTTVQSGGSVRISAKSGTFAATEPLTITTTGENGRQVQYGIVRLENSTATYRDAVSNADGGLAPLTVTFPRDAAGVYTIAIFSPSSPGGTVSVTVGGLSATGLNASSTLGIWIGGGALVLAGAVVAIAVAVRRMQDAADA